MEWRTRWPREPCGWLASHRWALQLGGRLLSPAASASDGHHRCLSDGRTGWGRAQRQGAGDWSGNLRPGSKEVLARPRPPGSRCSRRSGRRRRTRGGFGRCALAGDPVLARLRRHGADDGLLHLACSPARRRVVIAADHPPNNGMDKPTLCEAIMFPHRPGDLRWPGSSRPRPILATRTASRPRLAWVSLAARQGGYIVHHRKLASAWSDERTAAGVLLLAG